MVKIVFYEKPGCINNTRQKKILSEAGHVLDVRNLLTADWREDALRIFFEGRAVEAWFNMSAPAVKSGEVNPSALDADTALALMVKNPLLIRRPLMIIDGCYSCGFDSERLQERIGLEPVDGADDLERCPRNHA